MAIMSLRAVFCILHALLLLVCPTFCDTSSSVPPVETGAVVVNKPAVSPENSSSAITETYRDASSSSYWLANIKHRGIAAYSETPQYYPVFRNVKDFGAIGDGTHDDTAAINRAISSSAGRCGAGCNSSTTAPALVYFPPGIYLVSKPIIQYYHTQFVGDAVNLPTLKMDPNFTGVALIDTDPRENGESWYMNTNNFMRQIRNFVIDLTAIEGGVQGAGIHWQVAQGTSLQNIRFDMVRGGSNNKQQGIWMDNGSGGFMADLTFNGGKFGMWVGNQQFTSRNLTFSGCETAIYMNWNWLWAFKSLTVKDCATGIDMANAGNAPAVGSVLIQDSTLAAKVAIRSSFGSPFTVNVSGEAVPASTHGTLVLDNVDFTGSRDALIEREQVVLPGGQKIASWAQGSSYSAITSSNGTTSAPSGGSITGPLIPPKKDPSLLTAGLDTIFERSRPQYEKVPLSDFVSVKANGAKGDGETDDTVAIQKILDGARPQQVIFFDHGVYLVSKTIKVPKDVRITGEIWPTILAAGPDFQHETKPAPVFQVGKPGDVGNVEISDLLFSTRGAQPGAIMIQWNLASKGAQGSSGLWDVHVRIGGATGTELQSKQCEAHIVDVSDANKAHDYGTECQGAFLLLHITATGSGVYVENAWFWVADHELDIPGNPMLSIYSGRGVLIESKKGPVWMYATASEHSQLYQYQIGPGANGVYMSAIQSETPYYQSATPTNGRPSALAPFTPNLAYNDPTFSSCSTGTATGCRKSWGVRILSSSNILIYGTGLYSFFDGYAQTCLADDACQENMVSVSQSSAHLYGLSTKSSTNMLSTGIDSASEAQGGVAGAGAGGSIRSIDNRDIFCSTVAAFEEKADEPVPATLLAL